MGISINTNIAATRAGYYLSKNHSALQKSLDRLASGKRITQPSDDAGGLAVSMKLSGSINRLSGAEKNVANAISFLQVQDGILESAGNIVRRMGELKSLYSDVLKSDSDKATYDSEFKDLQQQIYQLAQTKFNGVSLFGTDANGDGNGASGAAPYEAIGVFRQSSGLGINNHTMNVYTSEDGSSGTAVSINHANLLSALTISAWNNNANTEFGNSAKYSDRSIDLTLVVGNDVAGTSARVWSFAAEQSTEAFNLDILNTSVFTTALENIATLRAENGGSVKRLMYARDNIISQITNMTAANGRIIDVDVAKESANLAKQQILVQAAASMTAQASMANEVALLLLR